MVKTYIDMDGVLARFEQAPHALGRFTHEAGFFQSLEPTEFTLSLQSHTFSDSTYILTSSPNEQADSDKIAWIAKYLPQLQHRVICVRSGEEKAEHAKGNILIDDYTENLVYWVKRGGTAVKALNGLNGRKGTHRAIATVLRVD